MFDANKQRETAVRNAWKQERNHVRSGKGTRDWSPSEQRQIVSKYKANGYEGHHMKSVKAYPQHAGDPNNIQFLTRNEHVNGAHRGNTQNTTNGYYDYKTGTMHKFGNRSPQAPPTQQLSSPLTQRQQNNAIRAEQARKQAARQAKSETSQSVTKSTKSSSLQQSGATNQTVGNKGIESMKNKSAKNQTFSSQNGLPSQNKGIEAAKQRASVNPRGASSQGNQPGNKGINAYQAKSSGQASGSSGGKTSGTGKGSSSGQSR